MAKNINLPSVDDFDRALAQERLRGSGSTCGSLREHGPHEDCGGHTTSATLLREQLQADRWKPGQPPPDPITKEMAVAELRRYRRLHPTVAPEVTAFELVRRADSFEELHAIEAAVDTVLWQSGDGDG